MRLSHPYHGSGEWYRGNLHTHTTNSDGRLPVAEVVDLYAGAAYDFLAITDHDVFTPCFEHPELLSVPGVEVSRGGPHLQSLGTDTVHDTRLPRGRIIDDITAAGGLCILNHPRWLQDYGHWPQAALEQVGPYHGIEVYNTVIERLAGEPYALDTWDRLLSKGKRVWGYANDDFHAPGDGPRGWNMVQADERTVPAILDALKAGRCYASTGVTIESLESDGPLVRVVAPDADEIRFVADWGQVRHRVSGTSAEYELGPKDSYVRVECWGRAKQGAFSQPFWVEPDEEYR